MRTPFRLLTGLGAVALAAAAACHSARASNVLFDGPSQINGRIIVTTQGSERIMRFSPDGPRQSVVKPGAPLELALPYTRASMIALAALEPKRVLIVGLGGGTMAMFLRTLYPEVEIDGVDIDPEVISVAQNHLGLTLDPKLRGIVADGRKFTESSSGAYDLAFLDAYNDAEPPRHLTTVEYLKTVRAKLSPAGLAVGNVWAPDANPHYLDMLRTWEAAFGKICVLDVPEARNILFLARHDGAAIDAAALAAKAEELTKTKALPFELALYARGGCKPTEQGGAVIKD